MIDLTGERFGKLTVVRLLDERSKNRNSIWWCKCDCGNELKVISGSLKSGNTKSCGCLLVEAVKKINNTKHGHIVGGKRSLTYSSLKSAQERCRKHKSYIEKGITIDDCLLIKNNGLQRLIAEIGERPSKEYTLDRIDSNCGYTIGNIRWATKKQQANNISTNIVITYNGDTHTLAQWAEKLNINYSTIQGRYKNGWPIDLILNAPSKKGFVPLTKPNREQSDKNYFSARKRDLYTDSEDDLTFEEWLGIKEDCGYCCVYCDRHQSELKNNEFMTPDHVKPKSKGGKFTYYNIVLSCNTCNMSKGDREYPAIVGDIGKRKRYRKTNRRNVIIDDFK